MSQWGSGKIQMRIYLNEIDAHLRVVGNVNGFRLYPKPRVACIELLAPPRSQPRGVACVYTRETRVQRYGSLFTSDLGVKLPVDKHRALILQPLEASDNTVGAKNMHSSSG